MGLDLIANYAEKFGVYDHMDRFLANALGAQETTLYRELTIDKIDPISKEPDFKFTSVAVSKYKKAKEKIIIAGAGAAAFRFLQNYRDYNQVDEIHVFSQESNLFYNRVLLPEYITEELTWQQLKKIKNAELDNLDINIHSETIIENIDKEHKKVTDSKGEIHTFDTLILATGSRPFIPKDVQIELPGRFTMRNKSDADSFKKYLEDTGLPPEEQHVVIVGGGLLGLELAAAMKHKNVKITIVQRASRLMERQLDKISSKLLSLNYLKNQSLIYLDAHMLLVFLMMKIQEN